MNAQILSALDIMHRKELHARNTFKANAYAKVIAAMKEHPPIHSIHDTKGIKGLGDGIRKKIAEILETGHLAAAEQTTEQNAAFKAHELFLKVYGVGPAKAKELVDAGMRTLSDLEKAKLNAKQLIGVRYYHDLLERIPRAEVAEHERIIAKAFAKADVVQVVGSYRRGAHTSGDVDVLIKGLSQAELKAALKTLRDSGYVHETLAEGPKKFMGIARTNATSVARRIDILLTPEDEFAYALLYFTGSDKFNVAMRRHALTLNWSLNEHGLSAMKDNKAAPPTLLTEAAIFEFLGMEYRAPEER